MINYVNPDMPVSEIMTRYLITVTPKTTLEGVNDIFKRHDFHHIPVVDHERLVGIISSRDLDRVSSCIDLIHSKANQLYNEKLFHSLLADEIMTQNAIILNPEDKVSYAAVLFSENNSTPCPS
ncbi:MAG: CBS domain-containing protein [Saprospiraceae bacterium]|nr:CBS domain-containing protein [Saprospiraceae bacterium]